MINLRRTTTILAAVTLVPVVVTACSGTGSPSAPVSSPASAPASAPASCHPGVSAPENWIISQSELSAAQSVDPSSVGHAVSPAHLMVLLLRGQTSSSGQEVEDFRSYAEFKTAVAQGAMPAGIRWVLYDNERWSLTPADEQADPVHYEQLFAQLAHRHGYKVILAPAQDLALGSGSGNAGPPWQSYLSMGLAAASARYGDIYEIQAQRYEMTGYRSQHAYASFVAAAADQAREANPDIVIYAGLSTQRVSSAAQLLQDYLATRGLVDGYWLNIPQPDQPGPPALADEFFGDLPTSASSGATCGGI